MMLLQFTYKNTERNCFATYSLTIQQFFIFQLQVNFSENQLHLGIKHHDNLIDCFRLCVNNSTTKKAFRY